MSGPAMAPRLTKITVNLTAKAVAALVRAADAEGLSRTEVINRALQLYDFLRRETADDRKFQALVGTDGTVERVHLL